MQGKNLTKVVNKSIIISLYTYLLGKMA